MTRRKNELLPLLSTLPWPIGIAFGVLAFLFFHYGLGWLLSSLDNPYLNAFAKAGQGGSFAMLGWMVMLGCFLAAVVSFFGSLKRAKLLETQSSLDSLSKLSWREFEQLVGEAFRRDGYAVEETGLGGKDGGIDLVLRKDGKKVLVQCKQWRSRSVNVSVAREMYGLLTHHRGDAIKIVAVGDFTADAAAFVTGKPIELIDGTSLLAMVKRVQTAESPADSKHAPQPPVATQEAPTCPRCQATMTLRVNRKTDERFWGCGRYPRCRGTRVIGL